MQAFSSLDELLLNPVVAAAGVVALANAISYATSVKPNWLAVAVSLAFMVDGYFVTGRRAPDELLFAAWCMGCSSSRCWRTWTAQC